MSALTVAVLSGGRSSEHDVSLASGRAVAAGLRAAGHRVLDVLAGRDGHWYHDGERLALALGDGLLAADVVFPALHGRFGEDGTVQGLFELLDVAYVGAGVLSSALCMDKVLFKTVMGAAGVPQVAYAAVTEDRWHAAHAEVLAGLASLGLPVFVKPARMGSSVGIVRVAQREALPHALEAAFEHDPLVIVEAAASGIEVECSVLGLLPGEGDRGLPAQGAGAGGSSLAEGAGAGGSSLAEGAGAGGSSLAEGAGAGGSPAARPGAGGSSLAEGAGAGGSSPAEDVRVVSADTPSFRHTRAGDEHAAEDVRVASADMPSFRHTRTRDEHAAEDVRVVSSDMSSFQHTRAPDGAAAGGSRSAAAGVAALASRPGEIVLTQAEWYDYEAKYVDGGMTLVVPARISATATARVRDLAVQAFTLSGCEGLARADFFVDGERVLVNELNTMPGFTPTSVYAKLMEASGVPYPELVDRLCRLGIERHRGLATHAF